jgi:hypothetical protein
VIYGRCDLLFAGVSQYRLCALAQYVNLVGVTIGYTITTAISMGYARASCLPSSRVLFQFEQNSCSFFFP